MRAKRKMLIAVSVVLFGAWLLAPLSLSAAPGEDHSHEDEHNHEQAEHQNEDHANGDSPYDVNIKTHPDPGEIVPDKDRVEMILNVLEDGQSAKDVELSYRIYAPPRSFWFGTDFPVVEGTQLLSGTVNPSGGQQMISAILPIRGEYRITTTVRGPKGISHHEQTFTVSENPQEVLNLSVFLLVLFLLGGIGGYFLTNESSSTTTQSWFIVWVGLLGFGGMLTPNSVRAHGAGDWDPHQLEEQISEQSHRMNVNVSVKLFPQPVKVGEMVNVRYDFNIDEKHGDEKHEQGHHTQSEETHSKESLIVESHFVHSEGGLEMVNQTSRFSGGKGQLSVQLFDGADHFLVSRFYRPTARYDDHRDDHDHEESDEQGTSDEDHEHGEEPNKEETPWEAENLHDLSSGHYELSFEESGDQAMKLVLISDDRENPDRIARTNMEDCVSVEPGATVPGDGNCYDLTLNEEGTAYELSLEKGGHYRMYTEHLPREFNMSLNKEGNRIDPLRTFVPNKGEYLGQHVERVQVQAVQPPFDDIFKSMVTLLALVGLGFMFGWKGPRWLG